MNNQVIIHAKAGQVPPRGFLQVALKNCPTYYGLAIRDNSGDDPVIEVVGEKKTLDVDALVKTLEEVKDTDTLLVLGNMPQDFDGSGDMMPFTFQQVSEIDGKETTEIVLAYALEGDLPNYSEPGKGHSEEFNMMDKFIHPEIMDKFEGSPDLPTFYDKLRKSNFEQALLNPVGHRAAFFFLPLVGDPIIYGRNELGGQFDWGACSNRFGWGDPTVIKKTTDVVNKARGRLAKLVGGTANAPAETPVAPAAPAPAVPDKPKENPPGVHNVGSTIIVDKSKDGVVPKPDTAVKEPYTMMEVPAKLQGNARNAWIRLFAGLSPQEPMPEGHQSKNFRLAVPNTLVPFAKTDVSTRDNVRDLSTKVKAFQDAGSVSDGMKEASKDAGTKANGGKEIIKPSASDYLPTMDADAKKGSVELVTDWATREVTKHPTPLDIQKIEAKWPMFTEQMGIKFIDMFSWTAHDLKKLAKTYPDALVLAFIEMRKNFVDWNGVPVDDSVKNPNTKVTAPGPAPAQSTGTAANNTGKKKSRLSQLTGTAA